MEEGGKKNMYIWILLLLSKVKQQVDQNVKTFRLFKVKSGTFLTILRNRNVDERKRNVIHQTEMFSSW